MVSPSVMVFLVAVMKRHLYSLVWHQVIWRSFFFYFSLRSCFLLFRLPWQFSFCTLLRRQVCGCLLPSDVTDTFVPSLFTFFSPLFVAYGMLSANVDCCKSYCFFFVCLFTSFRCQILLTLIVLHLALLCFHHLKDFLLYFIIFISINGFACMLGWRV